MNESDTTPPDAVSWPSWVYVLYKKNETSVLFALVRADNLGVHSREVVVDVVLLLVGVSLEGRQICL